jgi:hypothetical protein
MSVGQDFMEKLENPLVFQNPPAGGNSPTRSIYRYAGSISERLNAWLGGKPGESLCERAACSTSWRGRLFCRVVDSVIPKHCESRRTKRGG